MAGTGRKRKRATSRRNRQSENDDPPGEGGPDEAAAFIAETVSELAELARRHELHLLNHLLAMVRLEAEDRLRRRRKLS
ncbi:hypothetical protein [Bradyrhizobium sp. STM 3562]|uniref:hypothetical protein n=1 Tax=Bradyrhizobium sp. STM 3562 TaxID=578924 RepID=UPI00388E0EE5